MTGWEINGEQTSPDWAGRLTAMRVWVTTATRTELEDRAIHEFNRAEIGWLATILQHTDAELIAQRDASWAIADALDWASESLRPSRAELLRRRVVVVVPQ